MNDHVSDSSHRGSSQQSLDAEQFATKCGLEIQRLVGCKEITVLEINSETGEARRVFSSAPEVFPLFGTKEIPTGRWTELIVKDRVPARFDGVERIQSTFADHDLILRHGIRSVLNMPVVRNGRCVGSINCLFGEIGTIGNYQEIIKMISSSITDSGLAERLNPEC